MRDIPRSPHIRFRPATNHYSVSTSHQPQPITHRATINHLTPRARLIATQPQVSTDFVRPKTKGEKSASLAPPGRQQGLDHGISGAVFLVEVGDCGVGGVCWRMRRTLCTPPQPPPPLPLPTYCSCLLPLHTYCYCYCCVLPIAIAY